MSKLITVREIGSPFDDTSIKAALVSLYSEVLADQPVEPYEAIFYLNVATWRFALQFAKDFEAARSIVLDVWNSPCCFPNQEESQTPEQGDESWTN